MPIAPSPQITTRGTTAQQTQRNMSNANLTMDSSRSVSKLRLNENSDDINLRLNGAKGSSAVGRLGASSKRISTSNDQLDKATGVPKAPFIASGSSGDLSRIYQPKPMPRKSNMKTKSNGALNSTAFSSRSNLKVTISDENIFYSDESLKSASLKSYARLNECRSSGGVAPSRQPTTKTKTKTTALTASATSLNKNNGINKSSQALNANGAAKLSPNQQFAQQRPTPKQQATQGASSAASSSRHSSHSALGVPPIETYAANPYESIHGSQQQLDGAVDNAAAQRHYLQQQQQQQQQQQRNKHKSGGGSFSQRFLIRWRRQKTVFVGMQRCLIALSTLVSLATLALTVWVNVDQRFVLVGQLSSRVSYSTLSLLIGVLWLLFALMSALSLLLDVSQLLLLVYVRRFLNAHADHTLLRLVAANSSADDAPPSSPPLIDTAALKQSKRSVGGLGRGPRKQRHRQRRTVRATLRSVRYVTCMCTLVHVVLLLGSQYCVALYLHYNGDLIVAYQLPHTLLKLVREFESQQMAKVRTETARLDVHESVDSSSSSYVRTYTLEETLVDRMHTLFTCCHYQNPHQFGELVPPSCSGDEAAQRGCLNPMQDFVWPYLYVAVVVLLAVPSFKCVLQLVMLLNVEVILVRRLIRSVYDDHDELAALLSRDMSATDELNDERQLRRLAADDDDEEDAEEKARANLKLREIRRQKEMLLEQEELEEELQRRQKEAEISRLTQQDKIQKQYELMLMRQNRFQELKFEQQQRRLQQQHLLAANNEAQ